MAARRVPASTLLLLLSSLLCRSSFNLFGKQRCSFLFFFLFSSFLLFLSLTCSKLRTFPTMAPRRPSHFCSALRCHPPFIIPHEKTGRRDALKIFRESLRGKSLGFGLSSYASRIRPFPPCKNSQPFSLLFLSPLP